MTQPTIFRYPDQFPMRRGGHLDGFELAWESWGNLNPARNNAVLVFTGLSPSAHAASSQSNPEPGWWEAMVGPGKPIDTDRYFVICANSLGSCMGSTGPASINPATGEVYGPDFPELSIHDIAAAASLLLDHLQIEQLDCLVGPSMGGMSALAFLMANPARARRFVSLSSAMHAAPFAIAIRSLQREAIATDPHFQNGRYHGSTLPRNGMMLARKIGMLSYRSAAEWDERFGRDPGKPMADTGAIVERDFAIQTYLQAHAERFVGSFDPNCYLYLSRAMDWFDSARGEKTAQETVAGFQLEESLIMGVDTDILFPLWQQEKLAASLELGPGNVTMKALDSIQGHDAFLVDVDRFGPEIAQFLR